MAYGFKVEVWGQYGLFTRPELSVERMSYDVITPSAARGVLESIYWHPGMRYVIDRIHVLNEIKFTNIRRNEVSAKGSAGAMRKALVDGGALPHIEAGKEIMQRASLMLKEPRYVIEAHFDMTAQAGQNDNPGKFCDIMRRRLQRGQCYSQPYLGTRECSAFFRSWPADQPIEGFYSGKGERDLGLMLYDMDFSDLNDIKPMFYRACMVDGVIDVAGSEVYR